MNLYAAYFVNIRPVSPDGILPSCFFEYEPMEVIEGWQEIGLLEPGTLAMYTDLEPRVNGLPYPTILIRELYDQRSVVYRVIYKLETDATTLQPLVPHAFALAHAMDLNAFENADPFMPNFYIPKQLTPSRFDEFMQRMNP